MPTTDSSYTKTALTILRHKGFRITRPRKLVVELLDTTSAALSAYEIKEKLDTLGEKVDTVSVYRILECLEANHLIHRVLSTGKVKKCQLAPEDHCEKHQTHHCHHLMICDSCGAIDEVHCPDITEQLDAFVSQSRFRITGHRLEFVGRCEACYSKNI
jgi:Fur family zinc uptake transcriptional regulator